MQTESWDIQTAVIGTEHILAAPTVGHYRQLLVDVSELRGTEQVELRMKGAVVSGGTVQLILLQTFTGVVPDPHTQSDVMAFPEGGTFTLKQTTGTARTFPWRILIVDA
jgi:hypothetical protein